ncbi:MAG: MBL fold metallo-hydrolase, partial [Bacteroidales bacterium]|nr:MBL fold metallo-hydrolase [Bacteroidales bacterium]
KIICNQSSSSSLPDAEVLKNGSDSEYEGIKIEAVPAYNIKHQRSPGNPFHPKGDGNGYVLTLGDKRIYIAGDTENIPEMSSLKDINVAFLPMNLPYTMTPEMVGEAVRMFNPEIVYPYHFGETNTDLLLPLVDTTKTEVRIRKLN